MTEILFNKEGAPLLAFGQSYQAITKGAPAGQAKKDDKRPGVSKTAVDTDDQTFTVGGQKFVEWGDNNNFPITANNLIRSVGVLNTGLKFLRNLTIGQGIFAVKVTGYDEKGNEKLEVVQDEEITNWLESRMVRRYMEKTLRDYFKFGKAEVQFITNEEASKIVGINAINTMFCRYTVADGGVIKKVIVSGEWPETPQEGKFELFDLLDDYDPLADLTRRKMAGELKGKSVVMAIKDSWSNNDYYPEPLWYAAYLAGWVEVAQLVPKFLKKAYQNQVTLKWHIQIPYAFWDKKFPKEEYETTLAREAAIQDYMDKIEDNICGADNADKPIFTFFEINPNNGKAEEQWIITDLNNKSNKDDNLVTSAAANSEILFSLMINPNTMGAGMPGGTYAGNQGGSNIREGFLVNIANSWIDKQNILDPLELYLEYNGKKGIQLRFRNTILTTLDTGAGTKKELS